MYLNLIIDVTENCDCVSFTPRNIVPDIGILASRDPVAIDQASVDLINELPGVPGSKAEGMKPQEDKLKRIYLQNEEEHTAHISMLEHAEKIGLGTRNYELKEVEPRKKQN